MSTNYYFINKDARKECQMKMDKVDEIFTTATEGLEGLGFGFAPDVLEMIRWRFQCSPYRIHIGKRSMGWKPLFAANEYFNSMKSLEEWYFANQNEHVIENEYGKELTWKELRDELFNWQGKDSRIGTSYGDYYVDEDGYEWTTGEFS